MARIKKAQAGADTSKKVYTASFKRVIGDSVDMKKKVDSLGVSTSKAKDLLKARMAAKKQRDGGKTAAWTRKEGKNPEGGLNAKGRASYNKANPGSKLKAPQPQGGPRKKSFCARMSGMKKKLTSAKTAKDPNSRINKSLRKWNC
jgi:hypothetical protein